MLYTRGGGRARGCPAAHTPRTASTVPVTEVRSSSRPIAIIVIIIIIIAETHHRTAPVPTDSRRCAHFTGPAELSEGVYLGRRRGLAHTQDRSLLLRSRTFAAHRQGNSEARALFACMLNMALAVKHTARTFINNQQVVTS